MIHIFALDPIYPMDEVVATMEEAKERIDAFKENHPDIPVYWHPVHRTFDQSAPLSVGSKA